jgi:hypothetical protein
MFFNRYTEFDDDIYLLAFYLHPQYKGNLIIIDLKIKLYIRIKHLSNIYY